jgi:uncharacterized RDD family membrane protein YckC
MFTIIGGDGQEYGPVTVQQLRGWIAAGRANADTRAKAAGSDEWRRLADFPEFAAPIEPPPLIGPAVGDPTVAERWRRLLGAFVDGTLEALCWIPSSMAITQEVSQMIHDSRMDPDELMTVFWSSIHLSLPYVGALVILQAVLLSIRGQSIGNMIVRTRIVRSPGGEPAGFLRAFLLRGFLARALRQIPFVGGLFWIVDSCFIFREDRRCLHDLIAGTKVIKT